MDDGDIKQLMQEIEFVLKRNQNEKYLRANTYPCPHPGKIDLGVIRGHYFL